MNRTETPWLIVLLHAPMYNSYNYHYMEGESMRVVFEPWFVQHKVDVVFAGHVHAYERTVTLPAETPSFLYTLLTVTSPASSSHSARLLSEISCAGANIERSL